tara:strand:- start:1957 stop:2166 length:210 start_codon:yes stop_codon:yes gene_type:complete
MNKYIAIVESFLADNDAYTESELSSIIGDFMNEYSRPTGKVISLLVALNSAKNKDPETVQLYLKKYNSE